MSAPSRPIDGLGRSRTLREVPDPVSARPPSAAFERDVAFDAGVPVREVDAALRRRRL